MSKNKSTQFSEVAIGSLFFLPGVGVCRKTHPIQATDKTDRVRVVYPDDSVSLLDHNRNKK